MEIELSIIIPVYNVEKYLKECLDSIYKIKIFKEVIIINDNSEDNSFNIIMEYKKKYPKETIIINHEINRGLAGARNSGLKIAKGKYISFIDSDDIIIPHQYENIFLLNKNLDLDIIMGERYLLNRVIEKQLCRNIKIEKLNIISGKEMLEKMLELNCYQDVVWLNFYKRDFLISNQLFFYEKLLHEDTLFSFLAFNEAKKVKYSSIPFYLYRIRENSIMRTSSLKNEKHKLFICEQLISIIKSQKETSVVVKKFIFDFYWSIFKKNKLQNKNLLLKIILLKTKSLKIFVKKMIMLISYPLSKKINKIGLEEI